MIRAFAIFALTFTSVGTVGVEIIRAECNHATSDTTISYPILSNTSSCMTDGTKNLVRNHTLLCLLSYLNEDFPHPSSKRKRNFSKVQAELPK
jgi:hypothetical protein